MAKHLWGLEFILYTIIIEMGVMPELGQAVEEMDWR